jgi:hypothetical protein
MSLKIIRVDDGAGVREITAESDTVVMIVRVAMTLDPVYPGDTIESGNRKVLWTKRDTGITKALQMIGYPVSEPLDKQKRA